MNEFENHYTNLVNAICRFCIGPNKKCGLDCRYYESMIKIKLLVQYRNTKKVIKKVNFVGCIDNNLIGCTEYLCPHCKIVLHKIYYDQHEEFFKYKFCFNCSGALLYD